MKCLYDAVSLYVQYHCWCDAITACNASRAAFNSAAAVSRAALLAAILPCNRCAKTGFGALATLASSASSTFLAASSLLSHSLTRSTAATYAGLVT